MKIINQDKNSVIYEYDNSDERNYHIETVCRTQEYICTKIYGTKELFAEFIKK